MLKPYILSSAVMLWFANCTTSFYYGTTVLQIQKSYPLALLQPRSTLPKNTTNAIFRDRQHSSFLKNKYRCFRHLSVIKNNHLGESRNSKIRTPPNNQPFRPTPKWCTRQLLTLYKHRRGSQADPLCQPLKKFDTENCAPIYPIL